MIFIVLINSYSYITESYLKYNLQIMAALLMNFIVLAVNIFDLMMVR